MRFLLMGNTYLYQIKKTDNPLLVGIIRMIYRIVFTIDSSAYFFFLKSDRISLRVMNLSLRPLAMVES